MYGDEFDVVGQLFSSDLPELFKELRRRNDGGSSIKGKAILPIDIGATAWLVTTLQDCDPVTPRAQAHRGCQSSKATANDHSVRPVI
jgi:hypothetical protein